MSTANYFAPYPEDRNLSTNMEITIKIDERSVEALKQGRLETFGELLFRSHESSRMNFENSCPELDALVEIAHTLPECLGARLSGGGFGGITIHLVRLSDAETYRARLERAYRSMTGKEIRTILCTIGDGASVERMI